MSWFFEIRTGPDGPWQPRKSAEPPDPRGERIAERVFRPHRGQPVEISADHEHLTLAQLQAVYAPDGALRATQKAMG